MGFITMFGSRTQASLQDLLEKMITKINLNISDIFENFR